MATQQVPDRDAAGQIPGPAHEPGAGGSTAGTPLGRAGGNRFAIGCLAAAGVLVAAMAIGALALGGLVDRLNPFDDPLTERTVDRSGPPVLQALEDLGEYQAATAYYELVIDTETDVQPLPSFLAGERVLFVAAGNVDASVDFTGLDEGSVVVSEDRTSATITLPPPTLSEARLDNDRSYVYSRERGLLDRIGELTGDGAEEGEDLQQLYLVAEDRLGEAAASNGDLTGRAEENTRDMLTGLLGSLGYTDVTVVFDESLAPAPTGQ